MNPYWQSVIPLFVLHNVIRSGMNTWSALDLSKNVKLGSKSLVAVMLMTLLILCAENCVVTAWVYLLVAMLSSLLAIV
jgi:hypothetical protein